jgi:polysaccharide biosynthesis/export protein
LSRKGALWLGVLFGALQYASGATALLGAQGPGQAGQSSHVLTAADAPHDADYAIGPDDVLTVVVWREKDLSGDVVVRPDGRITLPLVGDLEARGLTPEALRQRINQAMTKYVAEPSVTVIVKQINSRKVFITGQVAKPGAFSLTKPTTVLQLISMAGGLLEFAKGKDIVIARSDVNGQQAALPFNYKDVLKGKKLDQNIILRPGDTVLVP